MFPAIAAASSALAGFVLGVIFAKPVFLEYASVKQHVTEQASAVKDEIAHLRADLKAYVEHLGQKL